MHLLGRSFLMRPGPKNAGRVRCIIKRERISSRAFPKFTLFLEAQNTFLLAACPRKNIIMDNMKLKKGADYTVSIDQQVCDLACLGLCVHG